MTRTDASRFPGSVKVMPDGPGRAVAPVVVTSWAAQFPEASKDRRKVGSGTWCTCSRRCSGAERTHCVDSQIAALTRQAYTEAARVQAGDVDPLVLGLRIAEAELLAAVVEIERRCAR